MKIRIPILYMTVILAVSSTVYAGDFSSYDRKLSSYFDLSSKQIVLLQFARSSEGLFIKSEKTDRTAFGNILLWRLSDDRQITVFGKDGPQEIYEVIFESQYDKRQNTMVFNLPSDQFDISLYSQGVPEREVSDTILIRAKNPTEDDKIDLWTVSKSSGQSKKLVTIHKLASVSIIAAVRQIAIIDIDERGAYKVIKFKY